MLGTHVGNEYGRPTVSSKALTRIDLDGPAHRERRTANHTRRGATSKQQTTDLAESLTTPSANSQWPSSPWSSLARGQHLHSADTRLEQLAAMNSFQLINRGMPTTGLYRVSSIAPTPLASSTSTEPGSALKIIDIFGCSNGVKKAMRARHLGLTGPGLPGSSQWVDLLRVLQ